MDNTDKQIDKSPKGEIIGAIIAILLNILFYVLLNNYYQLIPFLNEDFKLILPLYNLSIMVSIFINASRILFRSKIYKALGELVTTSFTVLIAYQLWMIFPFNTSFFINEAFGDTLFRFLLIVPTAIAIIVATVNFLKVTVEACLNKDKN